MKTIRIELAKTGSFGQDGTQVTAKDLRECTETFDGKGPVVLGHQLADWMPKFGDIRNVSFEDTGKNSASLRGDVEVNDLLADAIDTKLYEDWSLGIATRKTDGKRYIHHLAFLGAIPPKIRDLRVFADVGSIYLGDGGLDEVTEVGTKPVIAKPEPIIADTAPAASPAAPEKKIQTAPVSEESTVKEEDVELKEENAQLKKDLADLKATALSAGKETLRKAMEGRIPKAKYGLVIALADRLAEAEVIELADESGGKESVPGLEVLRRVIEAIPMPVQEGQTDLGDPSGEKKPLDLSKIKGKF